MAKDDKTAPLLPNDSIGSFDAAGADSRIPPLNPEDPLTGLSHSQVEASREIFGVNEITVPEKPLWKMFADQFTSFLPVLMEVAVVVSFAASDITDALLIIGMLILNGCVGFREELHAKQSLDELSKKLESEIDTRREGGITRLNVKDLVPGDVVLLVGGIVVPADIQWFQGDAVQVDTASLTGEPIPRKYPGEHGDIILSGTTVIAGECYGRVLRTAENTELGQAQADVMKDKTVKIVSVFSKKIMTVVKSLVVASLVFVIAVLFVKGFYYDGFEENTQGTILDALSIMIASIPIALPLVVQVNLASGASILANEYSAKVTTLPALQDIASISMLCSDKTGTLTTADMSIIEEKTMTGDGFSKDDVLMYASLCSNADKKDDPIDRAVLTAMKKSTASSDGYVQNELIGFNNIAKRVCAFVITPTGSTLTIAKGMGAKIIDTAAGGIDDCELQWRVAQAGDKKFAANLAREEHGIAASGYKTIAIAVCEGNARELGDAAIWNFVGLLAMLDPPRHDTPATIESLHRANISVKMITGDHANVGKETARLIGLGTNIHAGAAMRDLPTEAKNKMIYDADGFAAVLPSDKREIVMVLRNHFGLVTGMTGDGVNDAAALSAAQVGIAVDGATDAAKNAADLILTKSGLSPIYGAVLESRRIFARIKAYVIYRVAASIVLVLSLSTVIFAKGCAVESIYIILLALLNDVSMMPVAKDNAQATSKPQLPRARSLLYQSLFYGLVNAGLSLMWFFCLDYAPKMDQDIDLVECPSEAQGFVWFHLLIITELMIFSVRAPSFFAFSMPSMMLVLSVCMTIVVGALIACLALKLSIANLGYIIAFNVGTFTIVDLLKIQFRKMIGEAPGDIIATDELFEPPTRTEAAKKVEKDLRYVAHQEAVMDPADLGKVIEVTTTGGFFDLQASIGTGFVNKRGGNRTALIGSVAAGHTRRIRQASSPV